ncbi:hypothetical protein PMAYCL1PPCAC_22361, partial [Pristionchus mayeri]
ATLYSGMGKPPHLQARTCWITIFFLGIGRSPHLFGRACGAALARMPSDSPITICKPASRFPYRYFASHPSRTNSRMNSTNFIDA